MVPGCPLPAAAAMAEEQQAWQQPGLSALAVGETVILLHPPSLFSRCINSAGERMPGTLQSRRRLGLTSKTRSSMCRYGPPSSSNVLP